MRKIVRSGATAFEYERRVQPRPKIGPLQDELDELQAVNAARPAQERLSWVRIYEELRGFGYEGGYDAVRRYASAWERREKESVAAAYVPLGFVTGTPFRSNRRYDRAMKPISYARFQFPPSVIQHAVWLYLRFNLSLRELHLISRRRMKTHRAAALAQ